MYIEGSSGNNTGYIVVKDQATRSVMGYANKSNRIEYTFHYKNIASAYNMRPNASTTSRKVWIKPQEKSGNDSVYAFIKEIKISEKALKVHGGTLCDIYYFSAGEEPQ